MKKILFISALILSIYSNAQNVKRIPGCIFKENKNIKEYIIPKTRGISETPVTFSIKEYYPPVGDQGLWGTCTAWATTYASFTALNNLKKNRLGDALKEEECFSPQFTYDLIKLGKDETCGNGSSMFTALDLLKRVGAIPLSEYPYNCNILKNGEGIERLKNNFADSSRLKGMISLAYKNRLNDFIDLGKTNVTEKIKYSLINTHPVVIGISDFDKIQTNLGKDFWIPEVVKYSSFGHAMSVVSYDDNKNGGSFEIMNSWGKNWGNSGYCWVRYVDLEKLIRTAYALNDMKDTEDKNEFYDYKLSIQLIGEDSKPFEFENDKNYGDYKKEEFYLGAIDNSNYNFIYPSEIKKFQIGLSSESTLYFYLLSKTASSTVNVDYPISSKDLNLLDSKNSGLILPKNAQDYYTIKNFRDGWYSNEFLILFSKKQININAIIQSHKSEKFENLNSFIRSVFQDNIVVSDLTIKNNDKNNKMNITLTNDNNYILPIIIKLKKEPVLDDYFEPIIKKKKHKKKYKK